MVLRVLWEDKLGVEWSRGKMPWFPQPAKQLCISLSFFLPQPPTPTQAVLGDACPNLRQEQQSQADISQSKTSHNHNLLSFSELRNDSGAMEIEYSLKYGKDLLINLWMLDRVTIRQEARDTEDRDCIESIDCFG